MCLFGLAMAGGSFFSLSLASHVTISTERYAAAGKLLQGKWENVMHQACVLLFLSNENVMVFFSQQLRCQLSRDFALP